MTAQVPSKLVAGDTWSWIASFADQPAPSWVVTFYFQNGSMAFSVNTSASGTEHAASKPMSETADIPPGQYRWRARAVAGIEVVTVEDGWIRVEANPALGKADLRTDARKMLDALNATLIGQATSAQLAMTLNGRSLSRIPLVELTQWRDALKAEVATEEKVAKAGLSRQLRTRLFRA